MKVSEAVALVRGRIVTGANPEREVTGAYVSDLLSDVMAHAREGYIWLTIQSHPNVAAVALLTGLAAVVFTGGVRPDEDTVAKSTSEGINLVTTDLPTFEAAGILYAEGLRGTVR